MENIIKTQALLTFPLPRPSRDYDVVIAEGLKNNIERKLNYEKYNNAMMLIASGKSSGMEDIDYMPICADLELVNWCNIMCHMCPNTVKKNQDQRHNLSIDDIKTFLDSNSQLIEVRIQGIGEPFLYADVLIEGVKILSEKSIWSRTTTNGMLLNKNDNYKRIIDANIGEIGVSIDGASKESYEKIRLGSDFEKVCENSKVLNNYCDELGVEKTRMWVVAQKDNIEDLHNFPYFAKELGFSRLTISMNVVDWGLEYFKINDEKNIKVSQSDIDKLVESGREIGVDVSFWGHNQEYTKTSLCNWIFKRPLILADGTVAACCNLPHSSVISFGNIKQNNFRELWLSKEFQDFRRQHLAYDIPDICKKCYELSCNTEVGT